MVIAVLATVLVIAAIGAIVFALRSRGSERSATSVTTTTAAPATTTVPTTARAVTTTTAAAPPTLPPTTAPPPTSPPATADPNILANSQLNQIRNIDQTTVFGLTDRWVPQISAKKRGLVVAGRTFDDRLILQDFLDSRSRFSNVALLYSSDYPTFQSKDFWITIVAYGYATPDGANSWCDSYGLSRNDCFAKLISNTSGPAGATVLR